MVSRVGHWWSRLHWGYIGRRDASSWVHGTSQSWFQSGLSWIHSTGDRLVSRIECWAWATNCMLWSMRGWVWGAKRTTRATKHRTRRLRVARTTTKLWRHRWWVFIRINLAWRSISRHWLLGVMREYFPSASSSTSPWPRLLGNLGGLPIFWSVPLRPLDVLRIQLHVGRGGREQTLPFRLGDVVLWRGLWSRWGARVCRGYVPQIGGHGQYFLGPHSWREERSGLCG